MQCPPSLDAVRYSEAVTISLNILLTSFMETSQSELLGVVGIMDASPGVRFS